MKIVKAPQRNQCVAIIRPGEYLIDRWDNKQCGETSPYSLTKCDHCDRYYCLGMHWGKHLDAIQNEPETKDDFPKELPY